MSDLSILVVCFLQMFEQNDLPTATVSFQHLGIEFDLTFRGKHRQGPPVAPGSGWFTHLDPTGKPPTKTPFEREIPYGKFSLKQQNSWFFKGRFHEDVPWF